MQRLYFLIPDKETTSNIANELNAMGLTKDHLHVLGKDWRPLEKEGVPTATLIQTTDVANASKRGLVIGGAIGAVLGLVIHYILEGTNLVWMLVGMTIFGALFGVWTSTMLGVSVHDVKISEFEKPIKGGAMLMMADVPDDREGDYRAVIRRHHPEVVIDKVTSREKKAHLGQGR
ncbi:DUF1269 domain-containing protein [Halomonas sediminis]|uniref:DUF1269 domain-containing protein n=1 Tax=Vreelandella zhuhanensis TaxID=2684210 RepID=A0A7X3GZZ3_9GAMM|nr:DUF1269 domain-containing protein [Halomonas zhuhanensis]MWJ27861.1 DUF1269 domain-containing protein [Halomonas zhuhanensis]